MGGKVGKLSKVRFYYEGNGTTAAKYGSGWLAGQTASDHACDSFGGPGPDRELVDHDKIAGAFGTRYAFFGKKTFNRIYTLEMSDDNDTWLGTACVTRISDDESASVNQSYEIYEYDAGGQFWKARGCKCNSLVISWEDKGEVIAAMEWIGNGNLQSLSTTDGISTFAPEVYMTDKPYMIPSFSVGGVTTYDIIGYTANINNNLMPGPMNSSYFAKSLFEGAQTYDVEFTMFNPNSTALIDSANSGSLMTATVTNSDGTNTQTMTFSNCIITGPAPSSITPAEITQVTIKLTPTSASQFSWANA